MEELLEILEESDLYADKVTGSMQRAIEETDRRRAIKEKFNEENNITLNLFLQKLKILWRHKSNKGQYEKEKRRY